ncbi:uncharacterized protein [Nicotiana sylvestris]|uniref:uncharacterized protein n=1 Tax=Nicotiana sylvestris TaxID=4096 RepID=UPI00388CAFC8
MTMLKDLTKRIESVERKIEANDKKVETYNSWVDQISRAPPILKGLDSKKFVQKPFPPSAAPKLIPKKFYMLEIPKYNGNTDPNEHVTSYTCTIKGNDSEDDEIESVLLKKFGETLSNGAMIWYHNFPPNYIDSFAMLADSFVKAHAVAIKVATRKADLFKVRQRDNEMLREFVSRFQMERMDLPPVTDDWLVQAFTQGLNERRDRDANMKNEQEEPHHMLHMIVGGVDIPHGPILKRTKVTITREKRTHDYLPEDTLSFNNEDAEGIKQPHNDALVISIFMNKIQVKRVLVDPGSSANIIRSRVVEQLGLQDQIVPAAQVLNGFNMASETTKGEIMLPINTAGTI